MSTYQQETKHPKTGEWERATWCDDYFGERNYGVSFPSDNGNVLETGLFIEGIVMFDPREVKLETRDSNDLASK
jgi:hypothetical protein